MTCLILILRCPVGALALTPSDRSFSSVMKLTISQSPPLLIGAHASPGHRVEEVGSGSPTVLQARLIVKLSGKASWPHDSRSYMSRLGEMGNAQVPLNGSS